MLRGDGNENGNNKKKKKKSIGPIGSFRNYWTRAPEN